MPTFELFFEWSMMLHPALRDFWTVEQVLQLAQLGKSYQVFALSNQAATRIRDCLVSKRWEVTPQSVLGLWQISGGNGGNGLYSILCASLGAIPHNADITAWEAVMKDHPGLYQVHSEACLHKFTLQNLKNLTVCDVHDHSWHAGPVGDESKPHHWATCPLDEYECSLEGWIEGEEDEGRALCHHHEGGDSTPVDDWEGVVRCDHYGGPSA